MRIKSSEGTRNYRTRGGGCSLILAVPMTAMGALILFLGSAVLYRSKEPMMMAIAAGIFLAGGFILSVAIPIISTREGVTLDRIHGTATQWRTIFGHYKTLAIHNLNEFRSIEIHNHKNRNRTITHIVQLLGDSKKLVLGDLGLLERAKETAEDASAFLSLPITDKTMAED